jgi:importin subunit beta-1
MVISDLYTHLVLNSDLAETFEGQLKTLFQQDWITALLREARTSRHYEQSTKETARWAKEVSFVKLVMIFLH